MNAAHQRIRPPVLPAVRAAAAGILLFWPAIPATAAEVIPDDLIVVGNLGVGFDVVYGEDFGFDTVKLKENNLRIFFDDTSTVALEPANDWRIVANDGFYEGREFFAIEDVTGGTVPFEMIAGAADRALVVDSWGGIGLGLGTENDAADCELHLLGADSPEVRLEQHGGGSPSHEWGIAASDATFFLRDPTSGGVDPVRIESGAPSSTLSLSSDGAVGIGTDDPGAAVHAVVDASAGEGLLIGAAAVPENGGTLHVEGTAFVSESLEIGSSRVQKEAVCDLTIGEARPVVEALRPKKFRYRADREEERLGFIAEETPQTLAGDHGKNLSVMDTVAVLSAVVRENNRRERELEKVIERQRREIARISDLIDELERNGQEK